MASGAEEIRAPIEEVEGFVRRALEGAGVNKICSDRVARGLVWASARGVDTHGICLLKHYVDNVLGDGVNREPSFKMHVPFPSLLVLDADNGFGLSSGLVAMEAAMDAAETQGVAVCMVRNSSHPGAMGFFTHLAAHRGMIGVALTNTDPKMVSHDGARAFFGTNPIAVAAPRLDGEEPFSLDMATTAIPFNKVMVHRRADKELPEGYAVDGDGKPTTDPHKAEYLEPSGGYKGYGLAAVVETLTAVLSAQPWAHFVQPMFGKDAKPNDRRRISHFFLAMRTDAVEKLQEALGPHDDETAQPWGHPNFQQRMTAMSNDARSVPPRDPEGKVRIAGDPQTEFLLNRTTHGIPLPPETLEAFRAVAEAVKVPMEF